MAFSDVIIDVEKILYLEDSNVTWIKNHMEYLVTQGTMREMEIEPDNNLLCMYMDKRGSTISLCLWNEEGIDNVHTLGVTVSPYVLEDLFAKFTSYTTYIYSLLGDLLSRLYFDSVVSRVTCGVDTDIISFDNIKDIGGNGFTIDHCHYSYDGSDYEECANESDGKTLAEKKIISVILDNEDTDISVSLFDLREPGIRMSPIDYETRMCVTFYPELVWTEIDFNIVDNTFGDMYFDLFKAGVHRKMNCGDLIEVDNAEWLSEGVNSNESLH